MRATLLNAAASDGRAVAADGAIAAACAAAGATIAVPGDALVDTLVDTLVVDAAARFAGGGLGRLRAALGALVAFLASGGEYFSGCRFSLR